jgi:hypothetical protein
MCPCKKCKNEKNYSSIESSRSSIQMGFMPNYFVWTKHGERGVIMEDDEEEDDTFLDWSQSGAFVDEPMGEDYEEMGEKKGPDDALGEVLREAKENCGEKVKESKKFECMLENHKKLLYPDCKEGHKKLGSTLEMLQWKASNRISDTTFDESLIIVKDMLPEGNELPASTYEAKMVVCPLGLEVEKMHACPNDCILYQGEEYEKLEACPMCEAQRYKISRDDPCDVKGVKKKKKILAKVVWYFRVIPRLKRLLGARLMQR